MIASVPLSAWGMLPETGASSISAPSERTCAATSRLFRGLTVLMSRYTFPGPSPARIPSGPEAIASSAASSVTMLKITSAGAATSRGVSRHCQSALDQRLGLGLGPIGSVELVAGIEQASGEPAAHRAKTDESDRAHRVLPSISARSSSVSSRFAAARIGSTWSGRRKPTIAPSTAGLRSVQATATAPGVVSWRSATAVRRSTSSRFRESCGSLKRWSCLRQSSSARRGDALAGHAAGQHPGAHRRVDDHADALPLGERQDLPLGVALDQRVLGL